ncbi:MAG TPA: DUF2946 domain-containing protein, partial [Janthinobacterium sp.]|nr:DUF2946 domain-containing protein [Janthinobacterium sp.]
MAKFLKRRELRMKLGIWIACFAILMNMLAPSISHAMAQTNDSASLIEVCTVDGTRYVPAGEADQDTVLPGKATQDLVQHMQHCPFCCTHA